MDIMELGAIGELVGGVAVLATLVYLAIQVRQNNRGSQSSVYDGTVDSWIGVLRPKTESMDLFLRGATDYGSLSGSDALKFSMICARLFVYMENGFAKWRSGLMPNQEEWERVSRLLVWYLSCPGIASAWWPEGRWYFTDSFCKHVDEILKGLSDQTIAPFDHSRWFDQLSAPGGGS